MLLFPFPQIHFFSNFPPPSLRKQKLESLQTENENLQKQLQQQGASLDNLQEIQLQFDQSQSVRI